MGQKGPTAFTVCSERDRQSGVNAIVQVSKRRRWFRAPVPTLYHTTTALLTVCLFLFCLTSIKINETGKLYMSVKLFVYAIHVEISSFKPNNKILKRNITNVHERFGYNRYDLGYVIHALLSFGYNCLQCQ